MELTINQDEIFSWDTLTPQRKRELYNDAVTMKSLSEMIINNVKADLGAGIEVTGCTLGKASVTKTINDPKHVLDLTISTFNITPTAVFTCCSMSYPKLRKLLDKHLTGATPASKDKQLQDLLGDNITYTEKAPSIVIK